MSLPILVVLNFFKVPLKKAAVYPLDGGVSGELPRNFPRLFLKVLRVSFWLNFFGRRFHGWAALTPNELC